MILRNVDYSRKQKQFFGLRNGTEFVLCEVGTEFLGEFIYSRKTPVWLHHIRLFVSMCEGWNFNSGNYLFTTDTK